MAYYDGELLKQNLGKTLNEFDELNVPLSEVAIKIGQIIKNTPTADVVAVKHGYWFITEYEYFNCSVCGKDVPSKANSTKQAKEFIQKGLTYPHCPRCGAKMDGKDINVFSKLQKER